MSNTKKKKMTAKKRRQIQLGVLAAEFVLLIGLVIGVVVLMMNQDSISPVITKPHKTKEETESQNESKKPHALILESDKKIENPTLADVEEYWLDSCFFGDSIMYGFGSYLNYAQKGALANPTVVALVGYDLDMALSPLTKSAHPVYNGEKHTIFEVASAEQPKNIVLSFGINDLGKYGPEQFVENYATVITMLQAICPDARIFVVSTTWVYAGRESGNRNNTNIAKMNEMMEEYCKENGCGFIDVASYLEDTDTNSLFSGYTTDFFVHINNKAYDTWLALFRRYAYEALSGKEAPEEMFPITRPLPVATPQYEVTMSWDEEALPQTEETESEKPSENTTSSTTAPTSSQTQTTAPTTTQQPVTTSQSQTPASTETPAASSTAPSEPETASPDAAAGESSPDAAENGGE